jgi:hypothetical protein
MTLLVLLTGTVLALVVIVLGAALGVLVSYAMGWIRRVP